MSWTFQLESINRSFERIAMWYKEFMHRTECSFQHLHERISYLEERCDHAQGPTDEQLERVLRKILAERFSNPGVQAIEPSQSRLNGGYFVEDPKGTTCPRPIPFDPASLVTEPDSIPSKAYLDTFQMLDMKLARFPHLKNETPVSNDVNGIKRDVEIKKPRGSDSD